MEDAKAESRRNGKRKNLVLRTPIKTVPTDSSKESTPTESRISFPDDSPDFIVGSQECFRVSWDWRVQGHRDHGKPNSSPVTKLQARRWHPKMCKVGDSSHNSPPACLRPRRLIVRQDVNIHDVSAFAAELQSLAAGQKKINAESASELSTKNLTKSDSTTQGTLPDLPVTGALPNFPKDHSQYYFGCMKQEETQSNENKGSVLVQSEMCPGGTDFQSVNPKEDLNDLFDDSLSEDFIRCSQVVDRTHDAHASLSRVETPSTFTRKVGCSSKKKRLCLTLKKDSGELSARRSLNQNLVSCVVSGEKIPSGTNLTSEVTGTTKNNQHEVLEDRNNNGSSFMLDPFDDCDDDVLLSIVAMNETELSCKPSSKTTADTNHHPPTAKKDFFTHRNCYEDKGDDWVSQDAWSMIDSNEKQKKEDDWMSPDTLSIIDCCEKKAFEKQPSKKSTSLEQRPVPQKEALIQLSTQNKGLIKTSSCSASPSGMVEHKLPVESKETLSSALSELSGSRTLCTPEEIEQKRLEAIRKRRDRLRLQK